MGRSEERERLYKIGQAAEALGVKAFVLRFWETEFPQLEPVRTPSGQRLYTDAHLETVRRIKHLLYDRGLTIEGARRALAEEPTATRKKRAAADAEAAPAPSPSRQAEDARKAFLRQVESELLEIRRLLRS